MREETIRDAVESVKRRLITGKCSYESAERYLINTGIAKNPDYVYAILRDVDPVRISND
jgi:hypothetical protein